MIQPKISLCLIGKDEHEELDNLLKSVAEYMGEIIFVSTAANKEIEDVARKYGAKIVDYKWIDNFADARNVSFSHATKDFIFWADMDDTIEGAELLPDLAKHMFEHKISWSYMPYKYAQTEEGLELALHKKPRLIKNDGKNVWQKPVHESLVRTDSDYEYIEIDNISVVHQFDFSKKLEKEERNYRILRAEYDADRENCDPRTIFYLGSSLLGLAQQTRSKDQLEECITFFDRYVKISGWPEEIYQARIRMAQAFILLDDIESAMAECATAITLYPMWPDAMWYFCLMYEALGKYENSVYWGRLALMAPIPDTVLNVNPWLYDEIGPASLAQSLIKIGAVDEAVNVASKFYNATKTTLLENTLKSAEEARDLRRKAEAVVSVVNSGSLNEAKVKEFAQSLDESVFKSLDVQYVLSELLPIKEYAKRSMVIYAGPAAGKWGPDKIATGIGGSEEAVIYLSRELVKLGWDVIVYTECDEQVDHGVKYLPFYLFNQKDSFDVFISWRNHRLNKFIKNARIKATWVHDVLSENEVQPEDIDGTDYFIFLSQWARSLCPNVPDEKVIISNNGILLEQFEGEKDKSGMQAFYSSSAERGLDTLVKKIAPELAKRVKGFHLHIAYGWQTFDNTYGGNENLMAWKQSILDAIEKADYITDHGRIGHQELADIMKSCRVWLYPTEFPETNCITLQKAQAAGAIPVTTNTAAIPERIIHPDAVVIECDDIYTNEDAQKKFIDAAVEAFMKIPQDVDCSRFTWSETAKLWNDRFQ